MTVIATNDMKIRLVENEQEFLTNEMIYYKEGYNIAVKEHDRIIDSAKEYAEDAKNAKKVITMLSTKFKRNKARIVKLREANTKKKEKKVNDV